MGECPDIEENDYSIYWFLPLFKSSTVQKAYSKYFSGFGYSLAHWFMMGFVMFFFFVRSIVAGRYIMDSQGHDPLFPSVLQYIGFIVCSIGAISSLWYSVMFAVWNNRSFTLLYISLWSCIIAGNCALLYQFSSGTCDESSMQSLFRACNKAVDGGLPTTMLIRTALFPTAAHILSSGDFAFAVFTLIANTVVYIVCLIIYDQATLDLFSALGFVQIALFVQFCDVQQNKICLFKSFQMEKKLRRIEGALLETERQQLRSVLSNVANDIKTPLTTFVGGLSALREASDKLKSMKLDRNNAEDVTDGIFDSIRTLEASYDLMVMQVNRAVDVSSLEGKFAYESDVSAFDLKESVSRSLGIVTRLFNRNKVSIIVGGMSSMIADGIFSSRSWFEDNLLCLLSNAVQRSPSGSCVAVQLYVVDITPNAPLLKGSLIETPPKLGPHLVVEVSDNAMKYSEDAIKCFLSPAKHSVATSSAGLGFYSLALRIKYQGGMFGIYSRSNNEVGSVLYFTIPYIPSELPVPSKLVRSDSLNSVVTARTVQSSMADVNPGQLEAVDDAVVIPVPFSTRSGNLVVESDIDFTAVKLQTRNVEKTVLLVDDSLQTLSLLEKAFHSAGVDVVTATNGLIALNILKERSFHLAVISIQMPIMGGFECISKLRNIEKAGNLSQRQRIVAVSKPGIIGIQDQAFVCGADYFMEKPIDVKTLFDIYTSVLDQ
jgi:CheY-like chemotaxis protein